MLKNEIAVDMIVVPKRKASTTEGHLGIVTHGGHTADLAIDIDKLVCSLERELENVPQYMCIPGHPGKIGRIPQNLREANIKAYEPYFLSIGPYHHDNPKVQRMEKRKRFVLKCCLKQNSKPILKDLLMEIQGMESEVRRFYSDVEMDSEKFIQMLLLDCLYILSVFCGMPKGRENVKPVNDCMDRGDENEITTENNVDRQRWFWIMFPHDIFLVENQIPFFLLQKIHALVYGGTKPQLIGILKNKVSILLSDYINLEPEMVMSSTEEFYHLLHLCHMFFRPTIKNESTASQVHESGEMFRLGNVVQLYEVGVNFEAKFGSTQHSLLDITFDSSGKMVMPYLHVDDNVDSLLRNLIALEQMKYPSLGLNVSAYVVLLLHLVTTPEDVQLLRRKGIIQHHLASDKEMMHLINRLSVGLSFDYVEDNYSLKPVFLEMKRYTERRVPLWRVWLKHRYFNNPWVALFLLAASLLLLLTTVQTYYAMYSYYRPSSDGHLQYTCNGVVPTCPSNYDFL